MNQHPLWDYFDYRKAAITVLQDYATQAIILEHSDTKAAQMRQSLTNIASPRTDGMPGAHNPKAGEGRIASVLDGIDALKLRKEKAQAYMDWFTPAWEALGDDDRLVLETFFLDGLTSEDAAIKVADHFYVERKSAFGKKQRALARFARLLYGRD